MEKCLDEERRSKEEQIRDLLSQQESLLGEKESEQTFNFNFFHGKILIKNKKELLNKLSRTQEKLIKLKREKKLDKLVTETNEKRNTVSQNEQSIRKVVVDCENQQTKVSNDSFQPHKVGLKFY